MRRHDPGGRVVVGVVQQQHRAVARAVGHARAIDCGVARASQSRPHWLHSSVRQPRSRARRSAEAFSTPYGGRYSAGETLAVRLDHLLGAGDVLAHLRGRQAQQVAMAVAVQADRVTGGDDLARQRGVALHLLADQEERRLHARGGEDLEHRRSPLGVRTVVEREREAAPACRAILDPQRPAQRRPRAGERRAARSCAIAAPASARASGPPGLR